MKDYTKVTIPQEYIKNYNNKPYFRKEISFYEQDSVSRISYMGILIDVREILNLDFKHQNYVVTNVALDYPVVLSDGLDDVKKQISDLYEKLKTLTSDVDDHVCVYKETSFDNDLFDVALNNLISRKYTIFQKRYILGDLIKKGLKLNQAIQFLRNIE